MIRGRVLLLERDSALRLMIEEHLARLGCEVTATDDAAEAANRASLGRYDVALVSAHLAGGEPARLLGLLGQLRPPPVIVGLARRGDEERLDPIRSAGALSVLMQPFSRMSVEGAVRAALRLRREEECRRLARPRSGDREGVPPRHATRASRRPPAAMRIGRYELIEHLGRGSVGSVYRVREPAGGRDLALKVIHREVVERAGHRLRWFEHVKREASTAAAISHPNLADLVDFGVDEASHCVYLASELLRGSPLARRLPDGPMPAHTIAKLATALASGLAAAHEKDLVHRRVTPSNVVQGDGEEVKLTDLVVARVVGLDHLPPAYRPGWPAYLAPEQVRCQAVDARTDQFCLGTVLFEAVAGVRCFAATTPRGMARRIVEGKLPEPADGTAIPRALDKVLRRMLAIEPSERFQTDGELLEALRDATGALGAPST